ncbi:MAG TPA: glycoside hydrolase 43 family protein [Opitutaceae bacterium]|nr:glycoside hydrolase 43 family protein [Opitutaceae bacterium]
MKRPASAAARKSTPAVKATPWVADRGDGTYQNPVLFADYSDPDAIRVGGDYWMTSSSFCHVPGLPILHSPDLVNWTLVNHALPQLVPAGHFSRPRHGHGVWAPSIRHHQGKFWIYYPDPDFGLYVITTSDPRAGWSQPVLVKQGAGLIDPCPYWEPDGTGYLVHGWAKSRSGIKNRVTLHRLTADSFGVADAGEVIIDGDRMPGWNTIEGPKLYRRGEYYYIFAPAGGVTDGYQAVFRARYLRGPYENRIVLARGATPINGPHQGAWLDTPSGEHWFVHFQEMPAYGRVVHLQPLRWINDWPVIGDDPDGDGTGEPVLVNRNPQPKVSEPPTGPAVSDEFDGDSLGLQWQWQANPQPDWASLRAVPGSLRLRCVGQGSPDTLWSAAHLLMQKFPAPAFEVTTFFDFSPAADGDVAGLVVFGFACGWIGLRRERGELRLVVNRCDDAQAGGVEKEIAAIAHTSGKIHLRVSVGAGARCQFAFSTDGAAFSALGDAFQARSSYWVGAKVGLFASGRGDGNGNGSGSSGHVDIDWFRVTSLPV